MTQRSYDTHDLPFVEASVNYVVDNGVKPVTYISPYGESNRRDETPDHRTVPIYNARAVTNQLTLDGNGFEFHKNPTAVTDFMDIDEIETIYNPEVEKIVASATRAS
ncbi:MAG TPA: methyltransferase, partial [Rhodospirillaceae bacterium]|nr:methyltransferase [Rhodospirillaceae bacterium]